MLDHGGILFAVGTFLNLERLIVLAGRAEQLIPAINLLCHSRNCHTPVWSADQ
jgi:hypothetical protein